MLENAFSLGKNVRIFDKIDRKFLCFYFHICYFQIFLRCGVVGYLEDLRDERVKTVLIGFQTLARGWLARKKFRRLLDLRVGVLVAQRNTRQYFILRKWQWWRLFTKVKPLLSVSRFCVLPC